MASEYFKRIAATVPNEPVQLPAAQQQRAADPRQYIADPGLVDAVNTALLLNQALLLTGEPGTGKTQLAGALAHQLGYALHRFQAKSTSQARDLFYTYDAVEHFRAGQGAPRLKFVTFEALGKALLDASAWPLVQHVLPLGKPRPPRASVVLIDEIDKAPRDFPNDVLAEIDEMRLRLPELGLDLEPPEAHWPVVIVTSNSERDLPDAFLRRCVYYDIPFPTPDALREILAARLRGPEEPDVPPEFISDALKIFGVLRELAGIKKKPATAELLGFLRAVQRSHPGEANPLKDVDVTVAKLGVLLKNREDVPLAVAELRKRFGK